MSVPCKTDVLTALRDLGVKLTTIQQAIDLGFITDLEWAACLTLYRRKGRAT